MGELERLRVWVGLDIPVVAAGFEAEQVLDGELQLCGDKLQLLEDPVKELWLKKELVLRIGGRPVLKMQMKW